MLAEAVAAVPAAPLLTPAIGSGFQDAVTRLGGHPLVRVLVGSADADGALVPPRVYVTTAASVVANPMLLDECFGPSSLIVEYDGEDDLVAALDAFGGSLTATIHAEPEDEKLTAMLLSRLQRLAGRIIWNGWPTGVAVAWSMHHGGPWPATTNPLHTSVGVTAIRRFLVPVVYQNTPQELLPEVLRDSPSAAIPRRVDGVMHMQP
jgi:NADP-dependent aldehyde dehydrogenase